MSRKLIRATLALGLLALTAYGQQPFQPPGKAQQVDDTTKKAQPPAKTQADPTDALVQAALAHDGDVRIAQAKLQLAEAELAKSKQAVVLKVLTLNATVQDLKKQVTRWAEEFANDEKMSGVLEHRVLEESRRQLDAAKSALAKAEMELKLLTGGMQKDLNAEYRDELMARAAATLKNALMEQRAIEQLTRERAVAEAAIEWLAATQNAKKVSKGPIAERIRAALDKPVKLGPKGEKVTFEKALEVFKKEAGLDVPVRVTFKMLPITSEGEELPVGAWFQLFADNDMQEYAPPHRSDPQYLVREYGLLVTTKEAAPPDALTLAELWKQPLKKEEPKPKETTTPKK